MENIKSDTKDLCPLFWEEYSSNINNRSLRNILVKELLLSTEINTDSLKKKNTLSNFCDILILLLKKVSNIYNSKLDSYLDILNIMCIYSSLIKELSTFEKKELNELNMDINLVEEFINIFNNFDSILESNQFTKEYDIDISNNITISINKTKELYLRVCQCI
jgi:hypothetical protein